MLDGRRDQVAATFRTGDIAVIRDGLASTRPNEVGYLFRYRGVLPEPRYVGPQVVHHDPGPAFGEEFDVCPPQPAACPSHDRDLPQQRNSFRHLAILFRQRLNLNGPVRWGILWIVTGPPRSQACHMIVTHLLLAHSCPRLRNAYVRPIS